MILVDLGGIISHGGSLLPVITLFVSEASRVSFHLRRCIHLHFSSPHWDFAFRRQQKEEHLFKELHQPHRRVRYDDSAASDDGEDDEEEEMKS